MQHNVDYKVLLVKNTTNEAQKYLNQGWFLARVDSGPTGFLLVFQRPKA